MLGSQLTSTTRLQVPQTVNLVILRISLPTISAGSVQPATRPTRGEEPASTTMGRRIARAAIQVTNQTTISAGNVRLVTRPTRGEMPASATMGKPIVNPATLVIDPMNTIVDSVPNVITQAIGMLKMMMTVSMAAWT